MEKLVFVEEKSLCDGVWNCYVYSVCCDFCLYMFNSEEWNDFIVNNMVVV